MNPTTSDAISRVLEIADELNDLIAEGGCGPVGIINPKVLDKSNELHDAIQKARELLAKEYVTPQNIPWKPYPKSQSMRG